MKLKTKLFLGFGLILGLLLLSSLLAWYSMRNMGTQASVIESSEKAATKVLQAQIDISQYLDTPTPKLIDNITKNLSDARLFLDKAEDSILLPEQHSQAQNAMQNLEKVQQQLGDLINKNETLTRAVQLLVAAQAPAIESIDALNNRMVDGLRTEFMQRRLDALVKINIAKSDFLVTRIAMRIYINNPTTELGENLKKALDKALESNDKIEQYLVSPETKAVYEKTNKSLKTYQQNALAYLETSTELLKATSLVKESIDGILDNVKEITTKALTSFNETQNTTNNLIIGFCILGTTLGLIAATVMTLGITRPINNALKFAETVETGDFSARWNNNSSDELGQLASSLNRAFHVVAEKVFWFEHVLDAVPYSISVTDLNMHWTYANKTALATLKKSSFAEIKGKHCSLKGGQNCNTPNCGVELLRNKNQAHSTFITPEQRHISIDMTYLFNMSGEKTGHVEIARDVTAEESLKKETAEAIIRGRLETVEALEGIVMRLSTASEQLSSQIEQSDRGAGQVAQRMAETATAMEEMNSTVLEVAKNAGQASASAIEMHDMAKTGADSVSGVVNKMQLIHTSTSTLRTDMAILEQQAESIGQIMVTIADIADQTNLLALNAAIEAARAGDAGRGFAVVADEVRKLAEKTQHATSEVGNAITRIQQATSKNMHNVGGAVTAINETNVMAEGSGESLAKILNMSEDTADKVRAIATAAEEQSATSEEINQSIETVNQISTELSINMNEATAAVSELAHQASELKQLIEKLKN